MYYYHVWVRSGRYHSFDPLTYSSEIKLSTGSIVGVELKESVVLGFISAAVSKPRFRTKEIVKVYDLPPLNKNLVQLAKWMLDYYPSPIGYITKLFLPLSIDPKLINQLPEEKDSKSIKLPKLTSEQVKVIDKINPSYSNTYLLHGKTGSGKTRVYIELSRQQLDLNRSVIVLTPEISLTSQLLENFKAVFGQKVVLIHSKQTPKERSMAWLRCLTAKEPLVVIGPRSALFSPLANVGLIVIDESHELAYKHDQMPYYLTNRVASKLASISKAIVVMGSATPSISDYFLAITKQKPILKLNKLAAKKVVAKPSVNIIDLKDQDNFKLSSIISNQIIESIKKSLENHEQSLLYLNRRGTSRLILCQRCGWEAKCPRCNLPLVYHGDKHQLRCHSCSFVQSSVPTICPSCGFDSILFKTMGTKAISDELIRLFPTAKVARFDTDNIKSDSIAQNYGKVRDGSIDILVGTQQLAKGLDLPKLSTLGVLQADTSLYLPDFSSSERSFQLITQVLGRINRGHIHGRAFVQTYNPESSLIKAAINQDYDSFYKEELAERQTYKFPPFYYLLKLSLRRSSQAKSELEAEKFKDLIKSQKLPVLIEGPIPAFHEKFNDKYEWQLVVKSTNRQSLISIIGMLPAPWNYDIDPINLL